MIEKRNKKYIKITSMSHSELRNKILINKEARIKKKLIQVLDEDVLC